MPDQTHADHTRADHAQADQGPSTRPAAAVGASRLPRVIVLSGGLSHERDVSIRSGRRVANALVDAGHEVIESDVNAGLIAMLSQNRDAVVVSLLHGGVGENGALREVFQLLSTCFVGSSGAASRLAFDKSIATPLLAAHGIRTPRQVVLPAEVFRELGAPSLVEAISVTMGYPVMVKPTRSGSALGCTKVDRAEDLPSAMVSAYAYGDEAVVEEFIEGTEVAVAVLGTGDEARALPAVEIRPDSGVYDYTARYTAGATRFVTPAEVSDEVSAACAEMALTAHRALQLSGVSRMDIIIRDGQPVFIEANVAPGMTETSLVPLAMEAAGLDLGEAVSALVIEATHKP
ncbi:D-alanine--D-alanine ligase [Tessaracoccus sp. SD287]|uniref:D-alanine--D-alanine ligase family protein n=1 Tax=Tessaracoccus sp. SD287 TaxID=2782008 RepID=UPI001A96A059|nr:D-alanine--D-alanine ligase [Tessaracoccus sp. SD287]MBO1031899.1 D-alanine--D-alanine ligase [Tessaracoccus sp. SD287]